MSSAEVSEQPQVESPTLRVITPNTTPEEVAAIVAVLSSLGTAETPPRKPRSAWASPARRMRGSMAPGPSGWRLSGLPRA